MFWMKKTLYQTIHNTKARYSSVAQNYRNKTFSSNWSSFLQVQSCIATRTKEEKRHTYFSHAVEQEQFIYNYCQIKAQASSKDIREINCKKKIP